MMFSEDQKVYEYSQAGEIQALFYLDKDKQLYARIMQYGQDRSCIKVSLSLLPGSGAEEIREYLKKSHIQCEGQTVSITPLLLGGWDDRVHHGRESGYGTYQWAIDMGFAPKEAELIADGSSSVDRGRTASTLIGSRRAQGHHFDTDPSIKDSRVHDAIFYFQEAIRLWGQGKCDSALYQLGRGLHPLQDFFAHTVYFVKRSLLGFFHHLGAMEADDPKYVFSPQGSPASCLFEEERQGFSQRYSDTKTASYFYLNEFLNRTLGGVDRQFRLNSNEARIHMRMDTCRARGYTNFLNFIDPFCSDLRIPCRAITTPAPG
jgi:hypothetical protein